MNYNIIAGQSFSFPKETFTKNFQDLDGDQPCEVVILSLISAQTGVIKFDGKPVEEGTCFALKEVSKLTFTRNNNLSINDSFNFKISDSNQNKLYSNMATVTINIGAYTNLQPSQVGDLSVTINNAATKIFSTTDFTTGLTPPYVDPENDAPSKLKVLTLPASGLLKLNGVNVVVNQEIPFASIAGGLFTYVSAQGETSAIATSFDFAISDTGSGLFTS